MKEATQDLAFHGPGHNCGDKEFPIVVIIKAGELQARALIFHDKFSQPIVARISVEEAREWFLGHDSIIPWDELPTTIKDMTEFWCRK